MFVQKVNVLSPSTGTLIEMKRGKNVQRIFSLHIMRLFSIYDERIFSSSFWEKISSYIVTIYSPLILYGEDFPHVKLKKISPYLTKIFG
jgi:hypothetical protein